MQNEHGGIWNLNWLIEQTGAYPVEDYVYMVKAPFHKPIFYQDSWDAFHDPLYQKKLYAQIVQIPVRPISKQERASRRIAYASASRVKTEVQPPMVKADDYFMLHRIKGSPFQLNIWSMVFLLIGNIGMIVTNSSWFLIVLGISLAFSIASLIKNFKK